jgi:hypothetical protein
MNDTRKQTRQFHAHDAGKRTRTTIDDHDTHGRSSTYRPSVVPLKARFGRRRIWHGGGIDKHGGEYRHDRQTKRPIYAPRCGTTMIAGGVLLFKYSNKRFSKWSLVRTVRGRETCKYDPLDGKRRQQQQEFDVNQQRQKERNRRRLQSGVHRCFIVSVVGRTKPTPCFPR